jgi:hypothetical protein
MIGINCRRYPSRCGLGRAFYCWFWPSGICSDLETANQFCRGWLITGDTGSGKTSSGINQLAHQVFQNEPNWGGLCIDEKGVYWETLSAMAHHYGREHDLIHLQIERPDE